MLRTKEYWHISRKESVKAMGGPLQYAQSILELDEDGLVFIWPLFPDRRELCDVCRRTPPPDDEDRISCRPSENSSYPCAFDPVENIENQDIDDFIIDGAHLDGGGYFTSLTDYMTCNALDMNDYKIVFIGKMKNIREARAAATGKSF